MKQKNHNISKLSEKSLNKKVTDKSKKKSSFNQSNISQNLSLLSDGSSKKRKILKIENKDSSVKLHLGLNSSVNSIPIVAKSFVNNCKNSSVIDSSLSENAFVCDSNGSKLPKTNNETTKKKVKMSHKHSISTLPVNINSVVNIVNNNYTNIITSDMSHKFNKSHNTTIESNTYTYRKNSKEKFTNVNPLVIDAIKDLTRRSDRSNSNSVYLSNNIVGNKELCASDSIPSEVNRYDDNYNKFSYMDKIKLTGFKNYAKIPSKDNDQIQNYSNLYRSNFEEENSSNRNLDYYEYQKARKIFTVNSEYNLSNRMLNDEFRHHHTVEKNDEYKFIQKIRENKLKFQTFKIKLFCQLSEYSMFNILSYIYPQYDDLMNSNKFLSRKIGLTLNNKFSNLISTFTQKYGNILELQEYYFKNIHFKKDKSEMSIVDLVLKSKISTNKVNVCQEISLKYSINNIEYIQTWKLDIKNKNDVTFWFASEAEEYNRNIIRHCYYQPIVSFSKDDYIEMRINIFSKSGVIDPSSTEWFDVISFKTPQHNFLDYEKSIVKSDVKFDPLRFCELENLIHIWKNEKSLTKKQNIEEFKKYFQTNFKIISVNYDFFKFYIFKIKMQAITIGHLKKNKFTNLDIIIKPFTDNLTNETQCLGLLNINHIGKKVELRVSEFVIFYFTDLYL